MADYKDRLTGAPTAVATYVAVLSATSMLLCPTQLSRRAVTLVPDKAIGINYGGAATSSLPFALGASSVMQEANYIGPIYGACASGASAGVYVVDVFGNN